MRFAAVLTHWQNFTPFMSKLYDDGQYTNLPRVFAIKSAEKLLGFTFGIAVNAQDCQVTNRLWGLEISSARFPSAVRAKLSPSHFILHQI